MGKTRKARKTSEKKFMGAVLMYAKMNRWMTYHPYDSRRSAGGFPDLVLVHVEMKRLIFAELKVNNNKRTLQQVEWGIALENVGAPVEYYEWTEDMWPTICDTLRRKQE